MQGRIGVRAQHANAVDILLDDQPASLDDAFTGRVIDRAGDDRAFVPLPHEVRRQLVMARTTGLGRSGEVLMDQQQTHALAIDERCEPAARVEKKKCAICVNVTRKPGRYQAIGNGRATAAIARQ